ncbi:hypothetical protein [Solitalea lacus]|uniref:hypothetical protein n=1 Tax=Solitalea lacus TaxID=2911172 RepID=UPI001ED9FFE1|nr:hypothetical protein [Solitalea lacus]UKJ09061.1 hypothetical protein L2B55_07810 [Solitalea lacus]
MKKALPYGLHKVLLIFLIGLSYFTTQNQGIQILSLFTLSFAVYFILLKYYNNDDYYQLNLWSGALLRITVLFALPALSHDFYRYIWDGQLLRNGFDPFAHRPASYMAAGVEISGITPELYSKLLSPHSYSIYPPFCQSIYGIACTLFPNDLYKSVLVMKGFILLFELGTFWMIILLLKQFNLPKNRIAIYALNPLAIIEFCANLHLEAGMIFFTLLAIYLLTINRTLIASLFMAMAFCIKLLPIIFIPLLIKPFGFRKAFDIALLGLVAAIIFSLPFVYNIDQLGHIVNGLQQYYYNHNFNAGFYNLIDHFGSKLTGLQHSLLISKIIGGTFLGVLLYFTFLTSSKKELLPTRMMWILFILLLYSSAVFPWYCIALMTLSLFTNYRFPLIWTALLPLSYLAYQTTPFKENNLVIALEYILLFAYLFTEVIGRKNWIDGPLKKEPKPELDYELN